MIESPRFEVGDARYRAIGLLSNPFRVPMRIGTEEVAPTKLAKHAGASAFLAALDAGVSEKSSRPVWVAKSDKVPGQYHRHAVSEALTVLSGVNELRILAVYVPLTMFRFGRTRSSLSGLAERISGPAFPHILGRFALAALRELDLSHPDAGDLGGIDIASFVDALEDDPVSGAEAIFGPFVDEREGTLRVEDMMRDSTSRQERYDVDPQETDTETETDEADEPRSEFSAPETDGDEPAEAEPTVEEEPAVEPSELVSDYLIAYAKREISPVVARGLRVYRASGTDPMTQEFKVTKAPRKTMAALSRFACYYYRSVTVMYDQMDTWFAIPTELRLKIVASLSKLRWSLDGHATLSFLAGPGIAPELEEQFAAARQVAWDYPGLRALQSADLDSRHEVVEWLVESCRAHGTEAPDLSAAVAAAEAACADGDLTCFLEHMGVAVDDMAGSVLV